MVSPEFRGQTLVTGVALTIPNVVVNRGHASGDYTPYSANQATGYIDPTKAPPPSHNSGCGGIGAIIVAIVAIAIQFIPGVNAFEDASLLNAAIVGAGSDAIGQGVAIAVGAQHGFNWSQVALAGITAGITTGISQAANAAIPGLSQAASGAAAQGGNLLQSIDGALGATVNAAGTGITQSFASAFFNSALGSALSQGIGVATGLQHSFSWAGVAAAGIEGGVIASLAPTVSGIFHDPNYNGQGYFTDKTFAAFGANALSGAAALIAGAATRSAITGQGLGQSLQDELPNFVGQTIGNLVAGGIEQAQSQPTPTDNTIAQEQALYNSGDQRAYTVNSDGTLTFTGGTIDENVPEDDVAPTGYGSTSAYSNTLNFGGTGLNDGVYYGSGNGFGSFLNNGVYDPNQPASLMDVSGNRNSNILSYGQVQSLVSQNNLYSSNLPNNILIALTYKESSFNADAVDGNFLGLGQDNSVIVNDVNNQYNQNFTYGNDLFNPSTSLQVASLALDLKDTYSGGNGFNDATNLNSSNESWLGALEGNCSRGWRLGVARGLEI